MQNTLLTTEETSDYLQVSTKTLERMRTSGSGPKFKKIGRRVVYSTNDIEDWLKIQTFQSTAQFN